MRNKLAILLLLVLSTSSCSDACSDYGFANSGTGSGTIRQPYNIPMKFSFDFEMDTSKGLITVEKWTQQSPGNWAWESVEGDLTWNSIKTLAEWILDMPDITSATGWSWDLGAYYKWTFTSFYAEDGCRLGYEETDGAFNSCTDLSDCDSVPYPQDYQ